MLTNKRILLTGGTGFIGTALASRLADDDEIVLLDSLHRDTVSSSGLLQHPNVELVLGDVLDRAAVRNAARDADIVVHLAAIAGVDSVLRSPVATMRVNVLEEALQAGTAERVLVFSTSEVLGTHAYKVEETHIAPTVSVGEARWTYAVGKLAGEFIGHAYWHEQGLPVVTVRPFNIYGPGQTGEGAIHHFVRKVVTGEDLVVHGDGSQIRAWCYVDDMVEGILLAMTRGEAIGEAFNVGNPRSTVTVFDLAERIVRISGSTSKIRFEPLGYVDVESAHPEYREGARASDSSRWSIWTRVLSGPSSGIEGPWELTENRLVPSAHPVARCVFV